MIAQFQSQVPDPDCENLFLSDYSAEHIVDLALGWKCELPRLSKEELLALVKKILAVSGTEAEIGLMVDSFKANCLHPAKSDLIFWPDDHFGGNGNPTAEEIVEKAMSGK